MNLVAIRFIFQIVFIFGISGACRREELAHMSIDDIEDMGSAILVKIPENKTNKPRSFTVTGDCVQIYRKYAALRPAGVTERRFFLSYRNGKCTKQVVGLHKIGGIPKEIALFLNLQNAHEYTGHCFRRTSATLLVDAGADLTALKRHGGWKSSSVAEGYIDDSIANKIEVANKILNTDTSLPGMSASKSNLHLRTTRTENNTDLQVNSSSVIFQNCTNCTFNIMK